MCCAHSPVCPEPFATAGIYDSVDATTGDPARTLPLPNPAPSASPLALVTPGGKIFTAPMLNVIRCSIETNCKNLVAHGDPIPPLHPNLSTVTPSELRTLELPHSRRTVPDMNDSDLSRYMVTQVCSRPRNRARKSITASMQLDVEECHDRAETSRPS